MGLFNLKRKKNTKSSECIVQTVSSDVFTHPFSKLKNYLPLHRGELELYDSLREAVPIIDAAVSKIIRLTGGFSVKCNSKAAENALAKFLREVPVNGTSVGIESFFNMYFDNLLTYGTAVAEMVTDKKGRFIGLYNGDLRNIELAAPDNPMNVIVFLRESGDLKPIAKQNLLLVTSLNPKNGSPYGTSVLKGLPFVSEILIKIFNTIGLNWERVGNVRYAVTYKPSGDNDRGARDRAKQIASEWGKAMSNTSELRDFVAVGDVSIKVIGADNHILDSEVPVRQILEQIIAKLSIPPFLLGLSWSTTERMSSQQADILTSELECYRRLLEPCLRKICSTWLLQNGYTEDFEILWNDINLQDQSETANARYLNAKAQALEQESGTSFE